MGILCNKYGPKQEPKKPYKAEANIMRRYSEILSDQETYTEIFIMLDIPKCYEKILRIYNIIWMNHKPASNLSTPQFDVCSNKV